MTSINTKQIATLPLLQDTKDVEDYSEIVNRLFEEIQLMCLMEPGVIDDLTDRIVMLEKKVRQSGDENSASRLACKLLEVHRSVENWIAVKEWITILSKKRSQFKKVIKDMVLVGMDWVEFLDDKDTKISLIQTLLAVADGKMFLEVEKARLLRLQVRLLEEEGNYEKAAELIQDVRVEMFGGMDARERFLYILDQIRLVLMRHDYVRCHIISKKFNSKVLDDIEFQDIKLQYYGYLVQLHTHEKDYLAAAEDFWHCFNTPRCQASDEWKEYLSCYVIYLSMAARSEDILNRIRKLCETESKKLGELLCINRLVEDLLSTQLVDWPLPYENELRQMSVFTSGMSEENWKVFRMRRIHHNIYIISLYYSRIPLTTLSSMFHIPVFEVEKEISQLVYTNEIYARIDRPADIVMFGKPKASFEKLDSWTADISSLLSLVHETNHLINNERMVHAAMQKRTEVNEKV
ncbi:26S proteasome non-ATPase regulatory subunit 12-like [Hylaeus volcanicus]|uniref:26S proteasome non-ATPase regulatory subunit 12-like n=1 Tax=Hylaeus volcanicus TaxID=313075 RepID=UPI0023B81EAF|nr:26S proteasome non-ATPase regulatory subunit 12-like [Hylaeus volcanicus]